MSKLNIVSTTIPYNYNILIQNIKSLVSIYPFLEVGSIGYSVLDKSITYIKLGTGDKEVFYSASFHANEWITSVVLMKFIEDFCFAYSTDSYMHGYNIKKIFYNTSIYIVPMVNPDGVDLVTGNIDTNSNYFNSARLISENYADIPFPDGWKANIKGIDLNLQFPADWEMAKKIKYKQGFNSPAPRDYVGPYALSSPESKAVYDFTLSHNFSLVLAYHSQGKTIYWKYQDYLPYDSDYIAKYLSSASGYLLEDTPYNSSFAGFKDWFIQYYNKPGYTIEVGFGENPLPIAQFDSIYNDNKYILILAAILS